MSAMRQLDLFAGHASPADGRIPAPEPEPSWPLDMPGALPGQVGLFEPRSLLLGHARAALAQGQLNEACRALDTLLVRRPDDAAIRRETLETRTLRDRLARIEGARVARARHRGARGARPGDRRSGGSATPPAAGAMDRDAPSRPSSFVTPSTTRPTAWAPRARLSKIANISTVGSVTRRGPRPAGRCEGRRPRARSATTRRQRRRGRAGGW
jgi:hypothetical protein